MVHNNFGDLDDEDQEEEVIDLTIELVQLEREESLERSGDTVEINANEMYHLELDKIRDNLVNNENEKLLSEDSEGDDDDGSSQYNRYCWIDIRKFIMLFFYNVINK